MELEKTVIHKNKTPRIAGSQLVLEDDYNLPEYKPDIMCIIKSKGTAQIEEVIPEEEHVILQGKLFFEVLYQGEARSSLLDCLKGSISFRERVNVEGVAAEDNVMVSPQVEDMGVVVINSRKLSLRGLVDVNLFVSGSEEAELPVAESYPSTYQVREQEHRVLKLLEQRKDRMRIKQEISLPKEKGNIQRVLWQEVRLEQTNMRQSGDGVEMSAMMSVFVLYQSEKEEMVWYETSVPVADRISCEMPGNDGFYQVKPLSNQTSLEPREDLDGELRNISVEGLLELEVSIWQEETVKLLEDAYCMTGELHIHRHKEEMWQMAMKNQVQLQAEETRTLQEGKEAVCLCNGQGDVWIQEVRAMNGLIHISGICHVEVLYLTMEETQPLACEKIALPFSGDVEAGNIGEGDFIDVDVSLYRLQCSLVDGSHILCRGEVALQLLAFRRKEWMVPDELVEEPLDLEALQKQPGIIGYVVKRGDDLWDIAKRFHTTKQELMDTNRLSADTIQEGQKILVMKHIYL